MPTAKIITGKAYLQNLLQEIGKPSFSAIAIPTTLAEAPIGVPLPPMSVPRANVQARGGKGRPVAVKPLMT
jgi:hypothetical protein